MSSTNFPPLPQPRTSEDTCRRIGVEVELGGLPEARVARIARDLFGGHLVQDSDTLWALRDSEIGNIEVYLDASFRKSEKTALRDAALRLGREVIPVEFVTDPLEPAQLPRLDQLVAALRRAGALGSSAGLLLGFGVHFNIEIYDRTIPSLRAPLLAYALLEDWLRSSEPIDETRRVLPFTAPYPTAFVRDLIGAGEDVSLNDLIQIYLAHNPTRNRGLDMLPIFALLSPDAVEQAMTDLVSARPTFHFRLPDCRIDEADWSLAREWHRWIMVERVASNHALIDRLSAAWLDDHGSVTLMRRSWAQRAGEILEDEGQLEETLEARRL